MMRNARCLSVTLRLLLCVTFMIAGAVAQEGSSAAAPPDNPAATNAQSGSTNAELAKTSREAAGEDETEAFRHSPSVQFVAKITGLSLERAYWLCILVNFGIIAGGVVWLSKKNLPAVFRGRTVSIQKAMAEAKKASEDANRRLADIESRLSKLGEEIGGMQAAAEKEAANEDVRIKAATAEEARKIVESAEQEIAAAAKLARRELTAYAADLAVTLAGQQIKVDDATDEALVRSFAQQLSGDGGSRKGGR